MSIHDLCKTQVFSIEKSESIKQAAKLMREKNIGSLIVVNKQNGKQFPVGILTDRDIAVKAVAEKENLTDLKVSDVMCTDIFVLKEEQDLMDAINALKKQKVRRAPVVSKDGKLCGIVSVDDLLIYMAQGLGQLTELIEKQVQRKRA